MKVLLVVLVSLFILACGVYQDEEVVYRKVPAPEPADELSAEIQSLIDDHCGKCHGPDKSQAAINSPARLKASKPRIANDTMPPGGGLSDEVKAKLLND